MVETTGASRSSVTDEGFAGAYDRWESDSMLVARGPESADLLVLRSERDRGPIEVEVERLGVSSLHQNEYPHLFQDLPDDIGLYVWTGGIKLPSPTETGTESPARFASSGTWRRANQSDLSGLYADGATPPPVDTVLELEEEIRLLRLALLIAARRERPLPAYLKDEKDVLAFFLAQARAEG